MKEIETYGMGAKAEVMDAAKELADGNELSEQQLVALMTWCRGKLILIRNYESLSTEEELP
jgi:hypothetical protein